MTSHSGHLGGLARLPSGLVRGACACLALAACAPDAAPAGDTDPPVETVDVVDTVDSEADTVAVDTVADTDAPVDTPETTDTVETVETAEPVETAETAEPVETTEPVETIDTAAPPADTALPVTDWGVGFVDLTTALYASEPRTVSPGDYGFFREPDLSHGLIADLDGDGRPEVTLLGTAAPGGSPSAWVLRYDPLAEALVPDAALTGALALVDNALLAAEDLDSDGLIDLVRGRWRDGVAWGTGAGAWTPSASIAAYSGGHVGGGLFDLDQDGAVDLARTAGGCRAGATTWTVLYGRGSRTFYEPFGVITPHNAGDAHTVAFVTLTGGPVGLNLGGWCNFVSSPPGFFLPGARDAEGYVAWDPGDVTPPDSLYKLDPFVAGGPLTRVVPMGAAVADLNGDGHLEVAIGTLQDHLSIFSDEGSLPLVERTTDLLVSLPPRDPDGVHAGPFAPMKPWGLAALDLDRDGDHDLVAVSGDDASDWMQRIPGLHRALVFRHDPQGFVEETTPLGLPSAYDGRSLAVGDIDLDGRPDLVIGGHGQPPRVLLNRISGGRPPIAIRLVGTSSSPRGAVVRVIDGRSDASTAGGSYSPGPMSEPIAFASTTPDGVASRVEVIWPTGLVQQVRDLAAWQVHTLVEPELLRLSARSAPADGSSVVSLRVTPRDLAGAPTAGAVTVTLTDGTGAVGAPWMDGLTWVFPVTAPATPGYAVLEATVDGVAARIRPSVSWGP